MIHRSDIKGDDKGTNLGAISDTKVETKKEQLYERQ